MWRTKSKSNWWNKTSLINNSWVHLYLLVCSSFDPNNFFFFAKHFPVTHGRKKLRPQIFDGSFIIWLLPKILPARKEYPFWCTHCSICFLRRCNQHKKKKREQIWTKSSFLRNATFSSALLFAMLYILNISIVWFD